MAEDNELEIGIKKLRKKKRLPIYLTLILTMVMFILNLVENSAFPVKFTYFFWHLINYFYIFFSLLSALVVKDTSKAFWEIFNPFRNECVYCGLRIVKKTLFNL